MAMDAYRLSLQTPRPRVPSARAAPELSGGVHRVALPLRCPQDAALAAAASSSSRRHVSAIEREQEAAHHEHRRPSGSDDVGAFLARKATFERIQSCGAIACLRSDNEEVALSAARAALDGGMSVLEVTMRTSGAPQIIKKLVHEYPSAVIGAGTVLTWHDAERAKDAGAAFLMSPVTHQELVQGHRSSSVLFIPGAMSPSQVLQARRWGASCVKLYPVSLMGGIPYVKMVKQLFPSLPIIPANGITLDAVESYLQVGSTAVVTSDAIFNKAALAQRDYHRIAELAERVAAVVANSTRVDTSAFNYTRTS